MASNKNYNFKMDLSKLPITKKGEIDWSNSTGYTVDFTSDKLNGSLLIREYISKHVYSGNAYVITEYNGIILDKITTGGLRRGALGGILINYLFEWAYDIGDIIINKKNQTLEIIDRKYENGYQYYKILCKNCGFDSKKYYSLVTKEYKDEYWWQYNVGKELSCPCCVSPSKIVVKGINDIATTDLWMVKYFDNIEDCYNHTSQSSDKSDMICPHCNKNKNYIINNLHKFHYLPCECSDKISIPNKIAYYTFSSLHFINNYKNEYSPKWANCKRYDNYFKYNNKRYIVEMDGGFHYNDNIMSGQTKEQSKKIDDYKDMLAKKHNIKVIRVNCNKKTQSEIYDELIKELKNNIFNNHEIDFLNKKEILSNISKNITKDICLYYNEHKNIQIKEMANIFLLSTGTIIKKLQDGRELGWCDYTTIHEEKIINKNKIISIKNENPNLSTSEIAQITGLSYGTVLSYLKEGEKDETCCYDHESEKRKETEKRVKKMLQITSKKVYVYNKSLEFLGEYKSVMDLERNSLNDFGIEFKSRCVGRVCLGQREYYKNHKFSYVPLN